MVLFSLSNLEKSPLVCSAVEVNFLPTGILGKCSTITETRPVKAPRGMPLPSCLHGEALTHPSLDNCPHAATGQGIQVKTLGTSWTQCRLASRSARPTQPADDSCLGLAKREKYVNYKLEWQQCVLGPVKLQLSDQILHVTKGARMKNKSSSVMLCVLGTHPWCPDSPALSFWVSQPELLQFWLSSKPTWGQARAPGTPGMPRHSPQRKEREG